MDGAGSNINLLEVPTVVISCVLFKYLTYNELLGMRLTCKELKKEADSYINRNIKSEKEIFISLCEGYYVDEYEYEENVVKTVPINPLLQSSCPFPFSKFCLVYTEAESIFENLDWNMKLFGDKFGKKIIHLKMSGFNFLKPQRQEYDFYGKLGNLRYLTIGRIHVPERRMIFYEEFMVFPSTFRQLIHFHVDDYNIINVDDNEYYLRECQYRWKWLEIAAPSRLCLTVQCQHKSHRAKWF